MAAVVYADTHVVAWLYAGRADLIPARARALLEDGRILVSPIVALELEYLFETGRTTERARHVLQSLNRDLGLGLCDLPFPDVVEGGRAPIVDARPLRPHHRRPGGPSPRATRDQGCRDPRALRPGELGAIAERFAPSAYPSAPSVRRAPISSGE